MSSVNYFENAINSLAKVKEDISENNFDVAELEVSDADGETLNVSVHQDWQISAKKTSRTLSGQNTMNVNCYSKSAYDLKVKQYMSDVNDVLPKRLLDSFENSQAFCHCEDFIIDDTSIGLVNNCSPCKGSGKVACSSCGGSGTRSQQVHVRDDITYQHDGHGNRREISRRPVYESRSYTCGSCNGSGKQTCSPCGGSGYITLVTDVVRSAKLHQTYAAENGKYSDKTIAELMRLSTHTLVNFTQWYLGQSTYQENHFQIQYVSPLVVNNFTTSINDNKFTFMSFYDSDIESPHIFDKSPILDAVLNKPLSLASNLQKKSTSNSGYEFLELFNEYKILRAIMQHLSSNADYSAKNIRKLVTNESNGYMSNEKQELLSLTIVKTFKSCVPTYSKRAVIFSTIWLFFVYEVLTMPFLPLERKSSPIDWAIVTGIMGVIFTLIAIFISKKIVEKKHAKLPKNFVVPAAKHSKMALRFAGVFILAGVLSMSLHDYVFDKFFNWNLGNKFYTQKIAAVSDSPAKNVIANVSSESNPVASKPIASKKTKHKSKQ